MFRLSTVVLLSTLMFACSGSRSESTGSANTPEPAAKEATPMKWADMGVEERKEHMRDAVEPAMAKVFQAVNADRYKEFGCTSCHGEAAKEGKFEMPNAGLPKLDMANSFEKHMKEKPEVTKFMMQKVVPEMAGLLHTEPYNPETQKGFGCFNCHLMAQ